MNQAVLTSYLIDIHPDPEKPGVLVSTTESDVETVDDAEDPEGRLYPPLLLDVAFFLPFSPLAGRR